MPRRSLTDMSRAVARQMRLRRESTTSASATSAVIERRPAHIPAEARPELLDWVELRHGFDQWPAGTLGAIVDLRGDRALVEISDNRGHAVDLFPVSVSALRVAV